MPKANNSSALKKEILSVNLLLIGLTLLLTLASTLWLTLRQSQQALENNLMNSAQVIARTPEVAGSLAAGQPSSRLLEFLDESIRQVSDIDVIVVADAAGVQYYYPDHRHIGSVYAGAGGRRVLEGEPSFLSDDEDIEGAERCAFTEVRDSQGRLLGFVAVGIYMRSLSIIILRTLFRFFLIAAAVFGLGFLLSRKLSDKIKNSLLGYEPEAFLQLFYQREDILEALEEGILAIDSNAVVVFVNRAAREMLSIKGNAVGKPLSQAAPRSVLDRILRTAKPEYNVKLNSSGQREILANRMPIYRDKKLIGAVAIFRNRTEMARLAEDLTGVQHMVEAMRAYTHEFMNKLHVILGFLQLHQPERAEEYILEITRVQQQAISVIMRCIQDPSVAALLVGKTSRAAELGIQLKLDGASNLSAEQLLLPSNVYITILGNLIENSIEALNQTPRTPKSILVSIREEARRLFICVEDTGAGMYPGTVRYIFQQGFSTKASGRGSGLALVKEVVDIYQGDLRVESQPGVGTSFFITFSSPLPESGNQRS